MAGTAPAQGSAVSTTLPSVMGALLLIPTAPIALQAEPGDSQATLLPHC